VLYVSHGLTEILQLADRVILMKEGHVVGTGLLNDVFTTLNFRAQLGPHRIGAILDARVASHDPQYGLTQVTFMGHSLFVPIQPVAVGQAVRVHIFSNDVSLVLGETIVPTSSLNILKATVVEVRGIDQSSVEVVLDIGTPLVASITRKSLMSLGLKPGQLVFAHIKTVALNEEFVE
jgi:molybdate transport system ATP-binding protein